MNLVGPVYLSFTTLLPCEPSETLFLVGIPGLTAGLRESNSFKGLRSCTGQFKTITSSVLAEAGVEAWIGLVTVSDVTGNKEFFIDKNNE